MTEYKARIKLTITADTSDDALKIVQTIIGHIGYCSGSPGIRTDGVTIYGKVAE